MNRLARHPLVAAVLTLCAAAGCSSLPADRDDVIGRSALFSTTATAPGGVLEVEVGTELDPDARRAASVALKYGLDDRTELALELLPHVEVERPGRDARGVGDLTLGLTHRIREPDGGPALAFQLSTLLPVGEQDEDLSTGTTDVFLAAIASEELGEGRVTLLYELGLLGDGDSAGVDARHGASLGVALPVLPRAAVFGTLAGEWVPERRDEDLAIVTAGVGVSLSASAVLDLAVNLGLDDDAPEVEYLVGLTLAF